MVFFRRFLRYIIPLVLIGSVSLVFFVNFQAHRSSSLLSIDFRNSHNYDVKYYAKFEEELHRLRYVNDTLTRIHQDLLKLKQSQSQPKPQNIDLEVAHTVSTSTAAKANVGSLRSQQPTDNNAMQPANTNHIDQNVKSADLLSVFKTKPGKALFFTMDTITGFEESSKTGGAAGELVVRYALEDALRHFGFSIDLIRSDEEFNRCDLAPYDLVFLDPWTWAGKGWLPKRPLIGHEDKLYFLDFFGSQSLRGGSLKVPSSRFLTAFGSSGNTFLGYYLPEVSNKAVVKKSQGVIWGKEGKHFTNREHLLTLAADKSHLISTSMDAVIAHPNIEWRGHQSRESWHELLLESKFLLGLGDPLLGPSAIDAIAAGCVYINPIYENPFVRSQSGLKYESQHPFAANEIGEPRVCSYHVSQPNELTKCIEMALSQDLTPVVPMAFQRDTYYRRVKEIFKL